MHHYIRQVKQRKQTVPVKSVMMGTKTEMLLVMEFQIIRMMILMMMACQCNSVIYSTEHVTPVIHSTDFDGFYYPCRIYKCRPNMSYVG